MSDALLSGLASLRGLSPEKRIEGVLRVTSEQLGAAVASLWRYNPSSGYCTCFARTGYEGNPENPVEFVLKYDGSLISDMVRQLEQTGAPVVSIDLSSQDMLQRHWAPKVLEQQNLKHVHAFPFYNFALPGAELKSRIRGILFYYFSNDRVVNSELAKFLSLGFSDLYSAYYLTRKDTVTDLIVDTFGTYQAAQGAAGLLETMCKAICVELVGVEACSIYEWTPLHSGYRLCATTGLVGGKESKLIIDRRGGGLISAIADKGVPVRVDDVNNIERVQKAIGSPVDGDFVKQNAEITSHPYSSLMFIPVKNPIGGRDPLPSAILKFVNKRHNLVDFVDFFDIEDQIIGDEIGRMMALYEEQAQVLRKQEAFALQFGHEAQAPAVGIRGTADRLLYRIQQGDLETPQIVSLAQDMFDFSEIMIAFAESLNFGFGDRTISRRLRYKFRQTNLIKCIESAKKVVIPICREEKINFVHIRTFGRFPMIFVDNRAFMQVFYNLMTNAIKYRIKSKPGDFAVHISSRFVGSPEELSDRPNVSLANVWNDMKKAGYIQKGVHLVDTSDFGIGVIGEEPTKIFWEGYRSPRVSVEEIRGSGVGLTIVRNILADFDSLIWLEHEQEPTTFRIMIPDITENSRYAKQDAARRWRDA
jgi:signal transduction histidine kinase